MQQKHRLISSFTSCVSREDVGGQLNAVGFQPLETMRTATPLAANRPSTRPRALDAGALEHEDVLHLHLVVFHAAPLR